MNQKKKQRQHKAQGMASTPKVSEMVCKFAGDFISFANSLDEKQNRLNAACSAWNMACEPPEVREKSLKRWVKKYKQHNPDVDKEDLVAIRSDMKKLIENKLRLFPDVHKQIVGVSITRVGGKDHIQVVSLTLL